MEKLLFVLPLLLCPIVMGAMMLFMPRRGRRDSHEKRDDDRE